MVKGPTWTDEGIEETVAVNHLSHLALLDALRDRGNAPSVVVFIGSATHDPERWTGTPSPDESAITQLAFGSARKGSRQQGMTRYTTTKLMAVATAAALAREQPDSWIVAFDPGLMLDTRLGRQHPLVLRALYRSFLRGVRLLPFASTSQASGVRLAELLLGSATVPSGSCLDHRLRPQRPSTRALDRDYQNTLLADSRQIITEALREVPC